MFHADNRLKDNKFANAYLDPSPHMAAPSPACW